MKKNVKIALIIGGVLATVAILYFVLKPKSTSSKPPVSPIAPVKPEGATAGLTTKPPTADQKAGVKI